MISIKNNENFVRVLMNGGLNPHFIESQQKAVSFATKFNLLEIACKGWMDVDEGHKCEGKFFASPSNFGFGLLHIPGWCEHLVLSAYEEIPEFCAFSLEMAERRKQLDFRKFPSFLCKKKMNILKKSEYSRENRIWIPVQMWTDPDVLDHIRVVVVLAELGKINKFVV